MIEKSDDCRNKMVMVDDACEDRFIPVTPTATNPTGASDFGWSAIQTTIHQLLIQNISNTVDFIMISRSSSYSFVRG